MDSVMNLQGVGYNNDDLNINEIDLSKENSSESLETLDTNNDVIDVIDEATTNNNTVIKTDINIGNNENENNTDDAIFSSIDFGPLKKYLEDDNITDISYSNNGQLWLKSLSNGVYRSDEQDVNNSLIEKIAFQCSNVMGKSFNMAHPFLDSESAELRMNFVHESIARNGIAAVFRKTPAKIRLEKEKIIAEKYINRDIHNFLIHCVEGHCNIIVCGETGSGKTELVKYLASHTKYDEKLITIEDTLELHLDRIFPERDIVAMKTNNIASYSDVLVTCMRQNPKWILLSEVRSAEAVTAVRNSISSGHNILSTIHADKASSIPHRMYSLLESNIDVDQFLKTIYRYVQIGVMVRGRYSSIEKRFVREVAEVCEFYVDENNEIGSNVIYRKTISGVETYNPVSKYLLEYLEGQGVDMNKLRSGE
ncbi:MAG: CpaF/VirB11 family protein [bacterium]|nr:CpaF/VirB11 family protein [bacterium]